MDFPSRKNLLESWRVSLLASILVPELRLLPWATLDNSGYSEGVKAWVFLPSAGSSLGQLVPALQSKHSHHCSPSSSLLVSEDHPPCLFPCLLPSQASSTTCILRILHSTSVMASVSQRLQVTHLPTSYFKQSPTKTMLIISERGHSAESVSTNGRKKVRSRIQSNKAIKTLPRGESHSPL